MYKIVFTDIDGTLRNSKREITDRTKESIKRLVEQGIYVVLCSGRPRCDVEKISRDCKASRYIISSNGAEIYNYIEKKVEYKNMMKTEAIRKLYDISIKYDTTFVMNCGNSRISNKPKYKNETEIVIKNGIMKKAEENYIMQCIILDSDIEKIKNAKKEIGLVPKTRIINESRALLDKTFKPNGSIYCDVVDNDTSKGEAVKFLCNLLNIDKSEAIGIGDSYNDVEMLDNVGYSVAMKNSIRGLKSRVKEVTQNTNDLDGAAEFFESLLIKNKEEQ